ncbi:hypothetical protein [Kitasatospora sp. NBC_00315]|uniref:hypothetical protein n=1 Tax=Kitasatospora sp. NBC_00315 TaxID=2975963 RepID=UPI003250F652
MNTDAQGPVIVEIEDITAPARFQHLPDALAALWDALCVLPVSEFQAGAFKYFLTRPNAADQVRYFLDLDGRLDLTLRLADRLHRVSVHPAPQEPPGNPPPTPTGRSR